MKNSKPSKREISTLKKAAKILREYDSQQTKHTKTRPASATYNAIAGASAIESFIRCFHDNEHPLK